MTVLTLNPLTKLTHDDFRELCQINHDIQLELTSQGELVLMPPTGWESGKRNSTINLDLGLWNRQSKLGVVFDSSTGFRLPNGAVRSPDAAWVSQHRLEALNPDAADFLALAPDFVIELRSASDRLKPLQDKMKEYQDNGVRLSWLLNPKDHEVIIYRTGNEIEVLKSPTSLSGEGVLLGFVLDLNGILY